MVAFLLSEAFLGSLLAGVVVVILYGIFFAQREEKIRGYLALKRHGWVRARRVKAYVAAVRGQAVVIDTSLLGVMVMVVIPFAFASWAWFQAEKLQYADLDIVKKQARIEMNKKSINTVILSTRIISISAWAGSFYAIIFFLPLARSRRQLAYEIDRFTLRIQGLASKAELANLAVAESKVTDEESLREFVQCAGTIAARHDVPELVARFDLWAKPDSAS